MCMLKTEAAIGCVLLKKLFLKISTTQRQINNIDLTTYMCYNKSKKWYVLSIFSNSLFVPNHPVMF